jgi:outer membrane immunogenic protein
MVDIWSGFYIGANVGYSAGRANFSTTNANVFPASAQFGTTDTASNERALTGVIGGGQIGYNWQTGPAWVWGFEADFQGSGERNRSVTSNQELNGAPPALQTVVTAVQQKLDWFGTARVRLGYVVGNVMFYGTGGYAFGRVEDAEATSRTPSVPGSASFAGAATVSSTRSGWTAGGGAEAKLYGNWSAKVEYLFMDLGALDNNFNVRLTSGANNGAILLNHTAHLRLEDHLFRAGLNYKF